MNSPSASIYEIRLKDIDGGETTLEPYRGKVLLIVNVASKCGFTPQYGGLQDLHEKFAGQGLVVLGFPCSQFLNQEPGANEDIKRFCSLTYGVTFPMFEKIDVNGANRHPIYALLAGKPFAGGIKWNFTKFLVGRDGKLLNRFGPMTKPDSDVMVRAIESALAAK